MGSARATSITAENSCGTVNPAPPSSAGSRSVPKPARLSAATWSKGFSSLRSRSLAPAAMSVSSSSHSGEPGRTRGVFSTVVMTTVVRKPHGSSTALDHPEPKNAVRRRRVRPCEAEWEAMTMNASRRRAHDRLAALPGVRPVRRPVGGSRAGEEFDLYYVRTGRKSAHPLVVIPGGPGAASVALYRGLRRRAAAEGLDVIMVEHRGVGMSRHDDAGADLPPEALTRRRRRRRHRRGARRRPGRVGGGVRHVVRHLPGRGSRRAAPRPGARDDPRLAAAVAPTTSTPCAPRPAGCCGTAPTPETAELAAKVRDLVEDGVLTPAAAQLVAGMYGFAGPKVLRRQLDLLLAGPRLAVGRRGHGHQAAARPQDARTTTSRTWSAGSVTASSTTAAVPDGGPLDPAVAFRETRHR